MLSTVKQVLAANGMNYEKIPEESAYKLIYRGNGGVWDIIIFADKEKRAMSFICPQVYKAQARHPDILKIINHVNSNILLGKLIYMEKNQTISAVLTIPCNPRRVSAYYINRALQTIIAIVEHVTPYIKDNCDKHDQKLPESIVLSKSDPANIN